MATALLENWGEKIDINEAFIKMEDKKLNYNLFKVYHEV